MVRTQKKKILERIFPWERTDKEATPFSLITKEAKLIFNRLITKTNEYD